MRGTEARFYEVTESSPVGFFFTDIDGRRIYANRRQQELTGQTNDENETNGWLESLHPDDRGMVKDAWQATLSRNEPFLIEYRFILPSGEIRWVLGQAAPQRDSTGKIVGYMGTVTDITERKLSEEALKDHETRLVEAQRIGNIGFWERDLETDAIIWSDEMYRIYGQNREDGPMSPDQIFSRFPEEDRDRIRGHFRKCLETGVPFDADHRINRLDGELRWIHVKAEVTSDTSGVPKKFFGTTQDITETRQMQMALKQSEDRFRMTFDDGGAGMFICDIESRFVQVNKAFCKLLGYEEDELIGRKSSEITHPDDVADMPKIYERLAEGTTETESQDKRYLHKNGDVVWVYVSGSTIDDSIDGKRYVFTTVQDITDRKIAEQEREKGEERLEEAQRIGNFGVWSRDIDSGVIEWTDQVYRIFGFEPQSFEPTLSDVRELWHPDDVETVEAALAAVFETGEKYDCDHRIVRRDGTVRTVHEQAELERDEVGNPLRLFGTVQDVTEIRMARDELRLSEDRFRTAFNAGGAGMVISDYEGRYVEANRAFCEFVGYELEELRQMTSRDLTHPDERSIYDELREGLRSEDRVNIREKRYVRKDGETVWAITTGARVVDPRTDDVVVISNIQDITELKRAQEALVQNEARYRGVFDLGAAGVIVLSKEGDLLEYNRAFAEFIGHSDEELAEMKAMDLMHPAEKESALANRKALFAGEAENFYVERRFLHKTGKEVWAHLSVSVMQMEGLDPLQVIMFQDITEQRAAANALARTTELLDLVREVALSANQTTNFNEVVQFSLDRVCAFTGWSVGHAYVLPENEEDLLEPMSAWYLRDPVKYEEFREKTRTTPVDKGRQLVGEVLETGKLVWRETTPKDPNNVGPRGALLQGLGLRSGFGTPVKMGNETVGVLEFFSEGNDAYDAELADALTQVGTELGRVFERQRSELALQRREKQLRQIIDNAPVWIFVKNREGRYLIANKAVADSYGVTTEEVLGKRQEEFYKYPEEIERIRNLDNEVIEGKRSRLVRDTKIWNSKGEERDMRMFKLPFETTDGEAAVLGIASDVTDEKRAESELWRMQRMDALGHMTGGVAHDFNNLLTIILGNLQLLCRRVDDPAIVALAETAERAARRGGM